MRLAVGEQIGNIQLGLKGNLVLPSRVGALDVARDALWKEGIAGMFRGICYYLRGSGC